LKCTAASRGYPCDSMAFLYGVDPGEDDRERDFAMVSETGRSFMQSSDGPIASLATNDLAWDCVGKQFSDVLRF